MLTLSDATKKRIKDTLNHICERKEDELYNDGVRDKSWDRAEEDTKEEVLENLEDNFEISTNDYGFDWAEESEQEGFKKALIKEVKGWSYAS